MMTETNAGRWPPVYDFQELGQQIKELIDDGTIFNQFFHLRFDKGEFFQGDVVNINVSPVYIDKDGDISVIEGDYNHWLILGNTCDIARASSSNNNSSLPHLTHIT